MTSSIQTGLIDFALAYSLIGLFVAVGTSIARWYFPIVASSASADEHEPAERRVRRYQSIAHGFSYLEYVLGVIGTLVEVVILLANAADQSLHVIYLGVYGLLWLMLILHWQKRSIIGRVVTPRQQPVHGAVIQATHDNVHYHEATVTDKYGRFHLKVYPGDYQLTATKRNHEPADTAIATHSNNATRIAMVAKPNKDEERMTSPER